MFGVRDRVDFVSLGTGGRSLGAFVPPATPPRGDQLIVIEPPRNAFRSTVGLRFRSPWRSTRASELPPDRGWMAAAAI